MKRQTRSRGWWTSGLRQKRVKSKEDILAKIYYNLLPRKISLVCCVFPIRQGRLPHFRAFQDRFEYVRDENDPKMIWNLPGLDDRNWKETVHFKVTPNWKWTDFTILGNKSYDSTKQRYTSWSDLWTLCVSLGSCFHDKGMNAQCWGAGGGEQPRKTKGNLIQQNLQGSGELRPR